MQRSVRRTAHVATAFAAAALLVACSLAFPAAELSSGNEDGSDAGVGGAVATSTSIGTMSTSTSTDTSGSTGSTTTSSTTSTSASSGAGGCPPNLADCDGNAANGCEAELGTKQYCSGCDDQCEPADKSSQCIGGKCQVLTCPDGYADCNKMGEDGCETKLGTASNCAGCGSVCSSPDGAAVCNGGVCEILSCPADFFDCDNVVSNGCETKFADDGTCGTCAHHCTGSLTCQSGSCVCLSDADCNGGTVGKCGFGICFCYDEAPAACASLGMRCSVFGACGFFE